MITLSIINTSGESFQFLFPSASSGVMSSFPAVIALDTRHTITLPYRKAASPGGVSMGDFIAAGRLVFSQFPDDVQEYLQNNPDTPILIQTNDSTIPWELSHDGCNFQGLSRSIGRIMMLPIKMGIRSRPVEGDAKPSVLIIANPGRDNPKLDLPEADNEGTALCEFLQKEGCRVNMLAGKAAERFQVMAHLQGTHGTYDIVHYAGHAVLGRKENKSFASLVLADGTLSSHEINRSLRGSPVVFLNACHTIRSDDLSFPAHSFSYMTGSDSSRDLAQAFIIGNQYGSARALIGTLFRNKDALSRELALVCYRSLLDGASLGEALQTSRKQIYNPTDVTWASYVLYGDPRLKLVAASPAESSSRPEPQPGGAAGADAETGDPTGGAAAVGAKPEDLEAESDEPLTDGATISMEMLGDSAKKALLNALQESSVSSCKMLITMHLFLGMAAIEDGYTHTFLRTRAKDPKTVVDAVRSLSAMLSEALDISGVSDRLQRILRLAWEFSKLDPDRPGVVKEKHLLQGFFEDGGGITAITLAEQGVQMPPSDRQSILSMPLFRDKPPIEKGDLLNALGETGRRAVDNAYGEARSLGHPVLTTPHLFLGVLQADVEGLRKTIHGAGVDPIQLERILRGAVKPGRPGSTGKIEVTARFFRILRYAEKLSSQKIEAGHIGTAILQEGIEDPNSITIQILRHFGLNPVEMLEAMQPTIQGHPPPGGKDAASPTPFLDSIGKDLTRLARSGKLDPVIGKSNEIDAISEILLRKEKPCPVLIGEAGVGKTAIVKGFAQNLAGGLGAHSLSGYRVVEITTNDLVAGTKYRGDFEKRMQGLIREVIQAGNVILFLDEIHTLIGAGGSHGAMDAGNILKPALARGDIKCIGATTIDEYRRWIESDAALERRFTPVRIEAPTPEETVKILEGIRTSYEAHHGVVILSETLQAAVAFSGEGLPHRHLPDKAIDLLDRACSRVQRMKGQAGARGDSYPEVTVQHIREVLSDLTGVPTPACEQDETGVGAAKLADLEAALTEEVIGQPRAVAGLVQAVGLAETRMREPGRPKGVLMFTGPVGVGKSSLAKAFARADGRELIRLDMTEYTEKHQIAKLIGAPPGYIGHGREGYLTGKLRTHPHSLVLLDEMEKAHPDISQLFLHLFDEGRLTDAKGKTIDAQKAVFIMTCNIEIPSAGAGSGAKVGFIAPARNEAGPEFVEALQKVFSREFVDRIDQIIPFNPLEKADIARIARKMLESIWERFFENHRVRIEADEKAVRFICDKGYARTSGVRPLKRVIEDSIINPLSRMVLEGKLNTKEKLWVTIEDDKVAFRQA